MQRSGKTGYHSNMNSPVSTTWKFLAPNPKSAYKQLFIQGRRIRARALYLSAITLTVCARFCYSVQYLDPFSGGCQWTAPNFSACCGNGRFSLSA